MEYKQMGNHYVMRVDPGEEILEKIGILCKKEPPYFHTAVLKDEDKMKKMKQSLVLCI